MTLLETIRLIESVAAAQPDVKMIVQNDIFRLNAAPDARYGVFGWTQGIHRTDADSPFYQFAFTFFYIDRLTEDQGNQVEVQSVGVQTLHNIIRTIDDGGIETSDVSFQTFNQRFADECAGAFCNVTLMVPVNISARRWTESDRGEIISGRYISSMVRILNRRGRKLAASSWNDNK